MSAREQIPQVTALRLMLAAIGGNEPASSLIEIRGFTPDMRPMPGGRSFVPVRELDLLSTRVLDASKRGHVFVGAAPRVRAVGTGDAVQRVWTLWADCDTPEAVERLRAFTPRPSIVVRTSPGGYQAWWPLNTPLTPAHGVRANRRLGHALGGDMAATDAARVLRTPGTLNCKHTPPATVEAVRLELDVFDAARIVHGLDDEPTYQPRAITSRTPIHEPERALAGPARVIREAPVGQRNRSLNWASLRAAEHAIDPAEAEAVLLAAAVDAGLTEHEALRTIASGFAGAERRAA